MRRPVLLAGMLVLAVGCAPDSPTQPGTAENADLPALAATAPPITLTFMCGSTFRLRNPTDSTLAVTYDVYKTSERATLTLRPRASGSAHSETFFVTQKKGTVRVFSNGVLVQTKANGGFPCTGNRRLRVVQYQGVTGGPLTPSATHPAGTSVSYSFSALPGYHNLSVVLDGRLVPASGTIKMDNDHTLLVGADLRAEIEPGDQALLESAKAIIASPDPVAAYQAHLDRVGALFDEVGEAEASRRLAAVNFLAFDPLTDAAAIRRTSLALVNHEFVVRRSSVESQLRRSGARSLRSMESEQLEPTTIRYINGFLSNQGQVVEAARHLDEIVQGAGLDNENIRVTQFYNQTFSDPVETLAQRRARCLQDEVESSRLLNQISQFLRWVRCVDEGITYLIGSFDLVEASRQYLSVLSDRPLGAEADATALGQLVQADRANDRHVILVPHSQGNLITQLAILQPPEGSLDPSLGVCLAAVPLAAPTAGNWQLPSTRLAPVQVARDIILLTPSSHFPAIDTDSSLKAGSEIAAAQANAEATGDAGGLATWLSISWGVKLHQLLESYFPAPQSRQAIGAGLLSIYRDCAAETVSVMPGQGTLAPGESLQLSATAHNQAGNPLPGRKLTWTSANPNVASVDTAGLVRALAAGTTTITARAGGVSATAAIQVVAPGPPSFRSLTGIWETTVPMSFLIINPGAPPAQGDATVRLDISLSRGSTIEFIRQPGATDFGGNGVYPILEQPLGPESVVIRRFQARYDLTRVGDDQLVGTYRLDHIQTRTMQVTLNRVSP